MWWADRYEREPMWLASIAFIWGAVPAVLLAMVAALFVYDKSELFLLCVWAPLSEEIAKGLALLCLFVFYRKQFDGVLDGLVYGALIGFGFSMTEDFLYYIKMFFEEGPQGVALLVFLRGVVFALAHSVYTGVLGIGFGLASLSRNGFLRWLWPCVGLILAVTLHFIHNFGAWLSESSVDSGEIAVAAIGMVLMLFFAGLGIALVLVVVFSAWFLQRRIIREELSPLVGTLLSADELDRLATRWTQPVFCNKPCTKRRGKLAQLALRQRRLKLTGSGKEPSLIAETGRLHHELTAEYRTSKGLA